MWIATKKYLGRRKYFKDHASIYYKTFKQATGTMTLVKSDYLAVSEVLKRFLKVTGILINCVEFIFIIE